MYVEREIKTRFNKISENYGIVALVGARQSGKTTFLKRQMGGYKSSYVVFDDPDARELFDEDIKKFEMQYLEGYDVGILDEIQYCKDAGSKLKYLVDKGRKLWITSSSEILLSGEVLSFLVGRASILRLYPFSYNEFLLAKGIKSLTSSILKRSIWEHMEYGGYPKVVLAKDIEMKKTILRDLYETMLLKDISKTFSIDDLSTLEDLARYLSSSIGNVISYTDISNSLNISFQTVKKYIDAMEKSYLVMRISPYHTNVRKEISKQPKIYFVDVGLRNVINRWSGRDGRLFENYVFTELLKLGKKPKYWRKKSKLEIDFVVEHNNRIVPIEVKLRPDKVERSLRSFISQYKPKTAFIIGYNVDHKEENIDGCKIISSDIRSLYEYFSSKPDEIQ